MDLFLLLLMMMISYFQIVALWPISMVIGTCGVYIYRVALKDYQMF
jgi:hypothetical protein